MKLVLVVNTNLNSGTNVLINLIFRYFNDFHVKMWKIVKTRYTRVQRKPLDLKASA